MPPRKKKKTARVQHQLAIDDPPEQPHVSPRRSSRQRRRPQRLGFETVTQTPTVARKPKEKSEAGRSKQIPAKRSAPGLLPKQKADTAPGKVGKVAPHSTKQARKRRGTTQQQNLVEVSPDPKNKAIYFWLAHSTVGGETSNDMDQSQDPPIISSTPDASNTLDSASTSAVASFVRKSKSRLSTGRNTGTANASTKELEKYSMVGLSDRSRYNDGLIAREAKVHCQTDTLKQGYLTMIQAYSFPRGKYFNEKKWELDLKRSRKRNEAAFQRTAMMDIFDRETLYEQDVVDWNTELAWGKSPFFPAIAQPASPSDPSPRPFLLKQPQPDLVFSFKYCSIVDGDDRSRLKEIQDFIRPEFQRGNTDETAFPFCFVEAKRSEVTEASSDALMQNLNTASFALRNIWEVMRRSSHVDKFENVRVFSIVANADKVVFRIHRAEINKRLAQVEAGYPLIYRFDELKSIPNDEGDPKLTAEAVQQVTHAILVRYGSKTLAVTLREAVKAYANKKWQEDFAKAASSRDQDQSQASNAPGDYNKRASPHGPASNVAGASKRTRGRNNTRNGADASAGIQEDVEPSDPG